MAAARSAIAKLEGAGLKDVLYTEDQQPDKYKECNSSYWSLTPRLRPGVIVQPRTTEEVARALKSILDTEGCQFAIRSGGHMSWAGSNNIQDGVTIDLGLINQTVYNAETQIASIGPGGRWTDVYWALEKKGVMVAGGREGLVGVGGLILGGGITYYTCKSGFACDQVVNYEVVLADATIVNANQQQNADLFYALKGGGNNFGIVTRFEMVTFEARDVWDGIVTVPNHRSDEAIHALYDLTKSLTVDRDNHALIMWCHMPQLAPETFINLILTNIDGKVSSFRDFLAIPDQVQNTMQTKTMAEKVAGLLIPSNGYDTWFSLTFRNDIHVMKKAVDCNNAMVEKIKILSPAVNVQMVLQPFPAFSVQNSVGRGGNMMGLDRFTEDAIVLITAVRVETLELKEAVFPIFQQAIDEIERFAISLDANVEFRYLNYCDGSQNPLSTYGEENIAKMKSAAAKYDPTGVFQTRLPGGFKISKI
ncbi:FAD-binding domain-containing protein [Thozetella sp. PMI_491]|nr:FAD-binding domain-containing protein [Thozetella sp. PMI_491]